MTHLQKLPCSVSDGFSTIDLQNPLYIKLANCKNDEKFLRDARPPDCMYTDTT